jgi:hypothetical protein
LATGDAALPWPTPVDTILVFQLTLAPEVDTPALTAAIVTAVLALLGAIFGAWLSRRSEYEKWYRHEKALALAEYVRQLHDARTQAREAYYSGEGTEQSRSMNATEAFVALDKYTSLARLFMSEPARESLSELQKQLWLHCTNKGGPANRVSEVKAVMEKIQCLIEKELQRIPRRLA